MTSRFEGQCEGEAWIKIRTVGQVKAEFTPGRFSDIPENCYPDESESEIVPETLKVYLTVYNAAMDVKSEEFEITKEEWDRITGVSEGVDEAIDDMTDKALAEV
jgi:hypothetical protein